MADPFFAPPRTRSTLAMALREARDRRGFTQEELSELSGVGRVTIARIESGAQPNPELDTLQTLAEAMGLPVSQLVGAMSARGLSEFTAPLARAGELDAFKLTIGLDLSGYPLALGGYLTAETEAELLRVLQARAEARKAGTP